MLNDSTVVDVFALFGDVQNSEPKDTLPQNSGGVYRVWLSDRHYYIGRSVNIENRAANHLGKLQEGAHINPHMQSTYNLYKVFRVEVLYETDSREEQIALEQSLIDDHHGRPGCLNLCKSATGGGHSEATRKKMSRTHTGMYHTPESIEKMSEIKRAWHRENECPVKGKVWVHQGEDRKIVSPEEADALVLKGWSLGQGGPGFTGTHSEATREKMRAASNKGWSWMQRNGESAVVPPDRVEDMKAEGWVLGHHAQGRVWVNRNGENKQVVGREVDSLLDEGWTLGRFGFKPNYSEACHKHNQSFAGKKWVRNPSTHQTKRVAPEDLGRLLEEGWVLGKADKRSR